MSLPNVITLTFNGVSVTLNPDEQARYNLNELHKASNTNRNKTPYNWTRSNQEFLETQNWVSKRGRGITGTWGDERVVLAYAEWISVEFHRAVLDSFSSAMRGDGAKAVEVAQSVARTDGKVSRKGFVSGLAKHGADRSFYGDMSDTVNLIILGKTSSAMKEELGIKQYKPLRDHLPDNTLLVLGAVEALAAARLSINTDTRKAMAREITYNSANDVKTLLGL